MLFQQIKSLFSSSQNKNCQYYIDLYKNQQDLITTEYAEKAGMFKTKPIGDIISPISIDNRQLCSPTDSQGSTPHCVGYSCAQLIESIYWKKTGKLIQVNADQLYAKAKEIDKNPKSNGTYPECVLQAAIEFGALGSKDYEIKCMANDGTQATIDGIKHLIHKHDFLLCGFHITSDWMYCSNSYYDILGTGTQMGGHCVLGVGYDKVGFYIQNSWGTCWAKKGFGLVPWDVFLKQFMYCSYLEETKKQG